MTPQSYKGFEITVRSYQIRGSGRWTLDLLISHAGTRRAFSGATTFPNEAMASSGCLDYGRRIIDGKVRDCSVEEMF